MVKRFLQKILNESLMFPITAIVLGFGIFMFATIGEGQSPVLKSEELPSSSIVCSGVSMRVLWSISKYIVGEKAIWGESEARTMLFKPLDIGETHITFDGKTCSNVVFKRETVKIKEYLHRVYCATPLTLGIDEEVVKVIKTNCDLPGFAEYIRLRDRRLVIHINGVFFFFEPVVNY